MEKLCRVIMLSAERKPYRGEIYKDDKGELAWNIIDRGYSTYEELIDDFEKLLPLIKYKES